MAASGSDASPGRTSPYIVSPIYDWVFFLSSPVVALGLGWAITGTVWNEVEFPLHHYEVTITGLALGILVHGHLAIVVFRSHANPGIFRTHPARFVLVPILLYVAMLSSLWALVIVSVLATFWDVYHSALQTFGFGRIYESRRGGDPQTGRRLDYLLNLLLYAGPILAGVTMIDHFGDFSGFARVRSAFLTSVPAFMQSHQRYIAWSVIGGGTVFVLYYVLAQWRFHRAGHPISALRVYLYASTGLVSLWAWGFNPWGEAFFIMNAFHAFQYFGIVWAMEKRNMMRIFGLSRLGGPFGRLGKPIALVGFLGLGLGYGYWAETLDPEIRSLWALTLVVSIMHFWYDGFIWSVRRGQV